MKVRCYPQDGKRKSYDVCSAFATGCGGRIVVDGVYRSNHASMFYGIDVANEKIWQLSQEAAANSDTPWYYADNAYFDQVRGTFYRVAKNRLQHSGQGLSDGKRFKALGIDIQPWKKDGSYILLTPQSDHFMRVAAGYPGSWVHDTIAELVKYTDREIRVRVWNRDKKKLAMELPDALAGAHALVTYSSGSAISAITMGIPAISTAPECIAKAMCGGLDSIENPLRPEREDWLNVVADQQWTLDEFRDGSCWRAVG